MKNEKREREETIIIRGSDELRRQKTFRTANKGLDVVIIIASYFIESL